MHESINMSSCILKVFWKFVILDPQTLLLRLSDPGNPLKPDKTLQNSLETSISIGPPHVKKPFIKPNA